MDDYSFTVITQDPEGFVHIDDSRFPIAIGGIRLIKGVDKNEVKELAKAMSLKLHIFGFPMSGGKGGVASDDMQNFYKFISKSEIKELISGQHKKDVQLITGPDIGTSEDEYYKALEKAELHQFIRKGLLSQNSMEYSLPLDNIVTAYGAIVASEVLLRTLGVSFETDDVSFVIEGFGKVGTGLAAIMYKKANLVGISTKYGSIQNEDGFDILGLIEQQKKFGDHLVDDFENKKDVQALFEIPCDVLIPGARTGVITKEIAQKIVDFSKPKAIVPVSNAPYTVEGLKILQDHGIICFPDFIASAGAVIAAMIEFAEAGGEEEAMKLVKNAITKETEDLIMESKKSTGSLNLIYDLALKKSKKRKLEILGSIDIADKPLSIDNLATAIIQKYMP
ncbi:MAG: Glu/Leu/Phe/Val dehydrogenase [Candidatus Heimdallarchaeota archaeon]|nr:Glu/Leu/Phe/Val dehydrogenase [Candidatus Heimdallarchaeota archaeon]